VVLRARAASREDAAQRSEPARLVHARARVDVVQLFWKYPFADEQYVTDSAWKEAILDGCPFHPEGGCGVEKLGSYPRVEPAGVRIARWWCPKRRASISLLPAFLAARLSGTLDAVEDVVAAVEQAGSVAAAVDAVHPPETTTCRRLVAGLHTGLYRVLYVSMTTGNVMDLYKSIAWELGLPTH